MLSKKNKALLINKGLTLLFDNEEKCRILKNDPRGNSVPNKKFGPIIELDLLDGSLKNEIYSDCPMMMLHYEKDGFRLLCWDWVPGPGPGDFNLFFEQEEKLLEFIVSYYFEDNKYFQERLVYELNEQ